MNFYKNDDNLQTDRHTGTRFGAEDQLEIVGFIQDMPSKTKKYVVHCSVCFKDRELFGESLFLSTLGHLSNGKHPCGCAAAPKWNPDQQVVRVERSLEVLNLKLVNSEEYKGQNTNLVVTCQLHGEFTTTYSYIINKRGCRRCADEQVAISHRKPDSEMIASFFASGAFHLDTKFWRSDRKTSQGARNYWYLWCPVCKSKGEAVSSDLRRGFRPCNCFSEPVFSYVNLVYKSDQAIAIKYGISSNPSERVFRQKSKSSLTVINYAIWRYLSKELCRKAEQHVKTTLSHNSLSKEDFPDGYTETTHPENLSLITEIFESYGGCLIN